MAACNNPARAAVSGAAKSNVGEFDNCFVMRHGLGVLSYVALQNPA